MAKYEHLALSELIKNVHQQLREDSKLMGAEKAWNKHIKNEKLLHQYAEAMKQLSVNYWDNNMSSDKQNPKQMSRILWARDICLEYFCENRLIYYREKEIEVAKKINMDIRNYKELIHFEHKSVKILDVGSCYNPFDNFSEYFDVLPIDIAPATSDVFKCDFLKVDIGAYTKTDLNEVYQLENHSFHVVVFSLLLEYLPTPELRLLCCEKAYKLLKPEGLLLIITPDSKHVGANAKLMKSWQFILAKMGFSRIRYLKLQHIHCLAFRKSILKKTAERWAELHQTEKIYEKIYIPQDFNSLDSIKPNTIKKEHYDIEHLPNFSDIDGLF